MAEMTARDDLRARLDHVLWIGGAPDAGKTSVAEWLASRHSLQVYHFDRHEPAHFERHHPTLHAALHAVHPDRMSSEVRWVSRSVDEITATTIASWSERVAMAIDDILALPCSPRIVAEGPGFFPAVIAPILTHARQAIWLVPTASFMRQSVVRRDKPGNRHETSNPELARANLIARDLAMGERIRQQAAALHLRVLEVDGASAVEETAAAVEAHFGLDRS
jgi:hypothetical protein